MVHGVSPKDRAEEIGKKVGIKVINGADLTHRQIYDITSISSVVLYGSLYKIEDGVIRSTPIFNCSLDADEVYRVYTPCSVCRDISVSAVLMLKDTPMCRVCADNALHAEPVPMVHEGRVLILGDNEYIRVITQIPPANITKSIGNIKEPLIDSIRTIHNRHTGPGIVRYKLSVPRGIPSEILEEVEKTLMEESIPVEWV
jgi:hypothetical protein